MFFINPENKAIAKVKNLFSSSACVTFMARLKDYKSFSDIFAIVFVKNHLILEFFRTSIKMSRKKPCIKSHSSLLPISPYISPH